MRRCSYCWGAMSAESRRITCSESCARAWRRHKSRERERTRDWLRASTLRMSR